MHKGHLHWVVAAGPIALGAVGIFLAVAGIASPDAMNVLVLFLGCACLGIAVFGLLKAHAEIISAELYVTSRWIIAKHGFLTRETFCVTITEIEDVLVERGLIGRALGFGTVVIKEIGGGASEIRKVADPTAFRRAFVAAIDKLGEQDPQLGDQAS